MGADGRRNVVVNSVGREIDDLGQDDPREGSRVQLTIDYDMQKALEDGSGPPGSTARRLPRSTQRRSPRLDQPAAYNPQ